jgi:hypothetical protein
MLCRAAESSPDKCSLEGFIIREIIKSCRAPVVDPATTDYETTMAHYKFYKRGGVGGVVTYIGYKTLTGL